MSLSRLERGAVKETNAHPRDIIIVGGRIAGPRAAIQIATSSPDCHITILEKSLPDDPNSLPSSTVPLSSRASFPLLSKNKLRDLNLLDSNYVKWPNLHYLSDNPLRPANILRKSIFELISHINPKYIVDFEDIRDGIYLNTKKYPQISFVKGEFDEAIIQAGKVVGVKTTDGREFLGAVIDATGRPARVAKKIQEQLQKPIVRERRIKDPISVIGFYADLSQSKEILETLFSHFTEESQVAGTKNGIFGFIGPIAKIQGSSATHIIYMEGFKEKIDAYLAQAQTIIDEQLTSRGLPIPSANDKKGMMIRQAIVLCLQDRTDKRWHYLADKLNEVDIDRIISFSTKGLVIRNITKEGPMSQLTIVGDAATQTPPYFGQGFLNLAREIRKLANAVKKNPDLEQAFESYNQTALLSHASSHLR